MMYAEEVRSNFLNSVNLMGEVLYPAKFSHSFRGESFYSMTLSVARLSGIADLLPLTVPASLCPQGIEEGQSILVTGQLRSYRHFDGERNRLCLSVFCKCLQPVFGEPESSNTVSIAGCLLKPPIIRRTPLGRDICDLLVSVPRGFGKSDVIPVIAWGVYAGASAEFFAGQELMIKGRFQSREYQKKLDSGEVEQRTAYELSAMEISPA
ncbi:MAG: single-stranded DNA-binding protein [Christensenellales bacterium]|jgi:single-strand DNA-binding protein